MKPLRKVRKATHDAVMAQLARDIAIREAHASGLTIREIAAEAELSHARVHQILHGR